MAATERREEVLWEMDWGDLASDPPAPVASESTGNLPATQTESAPFPNPVPSVVPAQAASPLPAAAMPPRVLIHGQRARLSELLLGEPIAPFEASLLLSPPPGQNLDLCCFGLDASGHLSDDRYFIFFNQKSSPEGALATRGAQNEVFSVHLSQLPATVRRLVFTASVDGVGSVRSLGTSRFELRAADGRVLAQFPFSGADLDDVQALMVAEIYFKDVWRFSAVNQGFAGGLSGLLRHFGGQEI